MTVRHGLVNALYSSEQLRNRPAAECRPDVVLRYRWLFSVATKNMTRKFFHHLLGQSHSLGVKPTTLPGEAQSNNRTDQLTLKYLFDAKPNKLQIHLTERNSQRVNLIMIWFSASTASVFVMTSGGFVGSLQQRSSILCRRYQRQCDPGDCHCQSFSDWNVCSLISWVKWRAVISSVLAVI